MAKTTTEKKTENKTARYLAAQVGMSGDKPYAFHLEGNLTAEPHLLEAQGDKAEMAYTSMGISMGCMKLMAKATGKDAPEDEGDTFVSLNFYGNLAKKFMESNPGKGNAIAVCGKLVPYTDKQGKNRVRVMVDNFVLTFNGKRNKRFAVATNTFNGKNGVQNIPMVCLLTGNIIRVDELATSANGRDYLRGAIGLAIPAKKVFDKASTGKVGEYPEDALSIMNFVFFDEQAQRLAKVLRKGETVCVSGRVSEDTYEGNTSYTINPRTLKIMAFPEGEAAPKAAGAAEAPAPAVDTAPADTSFSEDEDDGELPF